MTPIATGIDTGRHYDLWHSFAITVMLLPFFALSMKGKLIIKSTLYVKIEWNLLFSVAKPLRRFPRSLCVPWVIGLYRLEFRYMYVTFGRGMRLLRWNYTYLYITIYLYILSLKLFSMKLTAVIFSCPCWNMLNNRFTVMRILYKR